MSDRNAKAWNLTIETALISLERGWATPDDVRRANEWRYRQRPQIGQLALENRKLTMPQLFAVLGEQATGGGMFGDIAVKLEFLSQGDVYELLTLQSNATPTLLEAMRALEILDQSQADIVTNQAATRALRPFDHALTA